MVRETFSTMLMITSSPALKLGVAFTVNVCSSSCDQLLVGLIQDGIHGVMQALVGGFRGDAHLLAQPPPARRTVLLDSYCSPVPAAEPLPLLVVNWQRGGFAGRQVHERSVIVDGPMPEQPAQQGQRLGRQDLIHERLMPGQRLQGAAARIARLLFGEVDYFWVHFGSGAQAIR